MKKLLKEFKDFISKGSVIDLAVGMIIGSAFTAIVSALVSGILTPLINWIPGTDGTGALQTVLRPAVLDAEGNVVTEALILDWGAVISAIITFICTAVVLFIIIKAINKVKEAGAKAKEMAEKLKDGNKAEEAPVEEAAPAEETAPVVEVSSESSEQLLKEIRDLLKAQQENK